MKGDDGMIKNIKNKILALLLLGVALVPTLIIKDATFLVLMSLVAVPLFFSKRNWIY